MAENKKRHHVILQSLVYGDNYVYLSLTDDQIKFFDWLCNEGIIDSDDYDLEVVESDVKWKEI